MDSTPTEAKPKKVYNTKPKPRIKAVFDKVVESGGKLGVSTAMRESGLYAEASTRHPEKITNSKTWKELLEERLPDSLLQERHVELLNKREKHVINVNGVVEQIDVGVDVQAVKAGLDMAYKLKGSYAPEKTVRLDVKTEVKPEDMALIQEFENKRLGLIENGDNTVAGPK